MRTYFDFSFPTLGEGCTMYSAELILYQTQVVNTTSANVSLRLYDLAECAEWSYTGITWNNQPVSNVRNGHLSLPYIASRALSSSNTATYYFDITDAAENYYYSDASDNGYMLALSDESKPVMANFGDNSATNGTAPQLRVYYTRPCLGCGDKCAFDTSSGQSCTCGCQSWEVCNCWECGYYCGCGKLNCAYGVDCECGCLNADECECVACKGFTTTTEDENGNVISRSVTNGTKTMTETYTYNTNNSLTNTVDVNGITTSYEYDDNSEQPSSIRISNSTTDYSEVTYNYNANAMLTGVSQSVAGLSNGTAISNSYTYNADEKVTSITHNDFSYNFSYNENGDNTSVQVGNQPLASYTYNEDGNITQIEYGNSDKVLYIYDDESRLISVNYNVNGTTETAFQFTYDSNGDLSRITNNRAGTETVFGIAAVNSYTVYELDSGEELHTVCYYNEEDDGYDGVETYGIWGYQEIVYNDNVFDFETGDTTYTETICTESCEMVSELIYDYFGRKTGCTTESTDVETENTVTIQDSVGYNDTASTAGTQPITYNSTVSSGDDSVTRSYRYSYDAKGNITAIYDTTATPEALIVRYTYDEACQLIREDNAELNKTVTYTYDKGGNLVSKTKYAFTISDLGTPTENTAYTYDTTWKDKLMSYGGTTLTYDEIGNPHNYTHDRLFNWVGRELREAFSEDGTRIEFAYNENGLRSLKRIHDDDTHVQDYHYFWSDDNRLLGYTLDTGEQDTADMQVLVLYNSDNEPIGFTIADMTFYYIKNIQGDVVCVTDSNGTPIVNYTYDAWGYPSVSPSSDETDNYYMMMVCAFNPVTYRGYLFDMELALYYLQSRYYDPELGRFLNADDTRCCCIENNLTFANLFAYCINNPIQYKDLTGNGIISKRKAAEHLAYNKKISLDDGYINGQGIGNVAKMKYGVSKMSYNGCELIAIYNALYAMGKKRDLAYIIYDFEMNSGIWMEGAFGTKPSAVGKYLSGKQLKLKKYYLTNKIDENTSVGDICVIIYLFNVVQIHTVMTRKTSNQSIDVYNRHSNDTSAESVESVHELVKKDGYKMRVGWIVKK